MIEEIYETAIRAGANGGKISGAGGGGFIIFYCPGNSRWSVIESLKSLQLVLQPYAFSKEGLYSYSV
jgi:D-glycero-alpha-D-manno-heptose-7-phosphate kinase